MRPLDEGHGGGIRDGVLAPVEAVGLAALKQEGPRGLVVRVECSESETVVLFHDMLFN